MTVLCHFYNEEYLLPWWLEHHKKIFDHGIMLNYGSTDGSVDLIKQICPHWTIVNSPNKHFSVFELDREMFELERPVQGWRIVLNVTEFLLANKSQLKNYHDDIFIDSLTMVTPREDMYKEPIYSKELLKQCTHGIHPETIYNTYTYTDTKINHTDCMRYRSEFYRKLAKTLKKYPTGRHYKRSREFIVKPAFNTSPDFLIAWFGYSPFTENLLKRKLQMKDRIGEDIYLAQTHYLKDSSLEKQLNNIECLQSMATDIYSKYSHLLDY
jgi:hypothetical protein